MAGGQAGGVARRRPVRRRSRAGLRLLLLLLLVSALLYGLRSPVFLVREVTITGYERLTPAEIQVAAGLDSPVLLWEIRPAEVIRRLQSLPRVYAADVDRRLPNRVSIRITEREPVALVLYHDRYFLEVDGTGRILAVRDSVGTPPLPVVTGLPVASGTAGETLDSPLAGTAAQVATALGREGRRIISEIHLDEAGAVLLYTVEGTPVFLGVEGPWNRKIDALLGIRQSLVDSGENVAVAYIDLRSAERPVVRRSPPESVKNP